MKRRILLGIIAFVLVVGLVGAYFYFKQTPDIVQDKPHAAVQAKDLLAAFEQDTAAARRQYIDKVVEVTGVVKRVDTSGAVVLGDETSPSEVVIGLDRRHMKDYESLKIGSVAVMQGICSGYAKSSSDPTDLLASLGTTVQLRSAGVKSKQ
ncbi:OB-fold protein [Flavisolibacter nicotianae]|uniref:OB-fold protein n=1 Tax=Flavisolibacter nicotianae TaxID=2364882 RepID=UPI000EAC7762|nr:hypothetical protein [Flavisolibacter nicotianae]